MAGKKTPPEELQKDVEAFRKHGGNMTAAARERDMPRGTFQSRLDAARRGGILPADSPVEASDAVPDGYKVRGTSTLYSGTGQPVLTWIKTTEDKARQEELAREMIRELAADLPKIPPISTPHHATDDLLAIYPVGDHHLGMLAWGEETGSDGYDVTRAEALLSGAFDHLSKPLVGARQALIPFMGDLLHYDSYESITPTNRNALDTDTRYPKMVRTIIRVVRRAIEGRAEIHQDVRVVIVPGNHDPVGSIWLAECLEHIYADNPRITVDTSPNPFHYHDFGANLIGMYHGHGAKLPQLPLLMATDCPEAWGRSKHRWWITGHIHQDKVQEHAGCRVESIRVLPPVDAWGHSKGYRSVPEMKGMLLHREHGEIARHTIRPAMLQ